MDKNDLSSKIDKIKKHYARQNYSAAVKIADDIDFKGEKDWKTLALMINLYEAVKRPVDVRYFCVLAYNRNLGGRKLLYKLAKVCIALGEIDEAEDLYDEYSRGSGSEGKKLELRYELRKAQGAGIDELIQILERLAEVDFDDRYGYFLAYLYSKNKQYEKCVQTCDKIIENYMDGDFVEKTKNLRSFYVGAGGSIEPPEPEEKESLGNTKIFHGKSVREEITPIKREEAVKENPVEEAAVTREEVTVTQMPEEDSVKPEEESANEVAQAEAGEEEDFVQEKVPEDVLRMQPSEEEVSQDQSASSAVENARQSVMQIINSAKKSVECTYEEVKKETEMQDIKVKVPDNTRFDTKSLQETLAKAVSECFEEEDTQEVPVESVKQVIEKAEPKEIPQEAPVVEKTEEQPVVEHEQEEAVVEEPIKVDTAPIEVELVEEAVTGSRKQPVTDGKDAKPEEDAEVKEAMDMVAAALADEVKEEVVKNKPSVDDVPTNKITIQKKTYEEVVRQTNTANIPISVRRYFTKYNNVEGLTEQIGEFLQSTMEVENDEKQGTSAVGNLIISGNRSSDKKQLAINIIKALNDLDSDHVRKIAATSGDSINQRGIAKSMVKVVGAALIIEEAGALDNKRVEELLRVMRGETEEMLVIIEDSESEINNLIRRCPEIKEVFNHRIVYKQYNVNELVDMCKAYAEKNNFLIDDKAMFLLYEKINEIHGHEEGVNLVEVRAVVDSAIDHAERRAGKLLFGGIKKKKVEDKEYYILVESDFKA